MPSNFKKARIKSKFSLKAARIGATTKPNDTRNGTELRRNKEVDRSRKSFDEKLRHLHERHVGKKNNTDKHPPIVIGSPTFIYHPSSKNVSVVQQQQDLKEPRFDFVDDLFISDESVNMRVIHRNNDTNSAKINTYKALEEEPERVNILPATFIIR